MSIIDRIVEAASKLRAATGERAKYLYLGESEMIELSDYVSETAGRRISVGAGATVYGMYLFIVISPSHLAVS